MVLDLLDEALAAARVGVAAVHEAVEVDLAQAVVPGYVAECEDVVERGVHAAGGCEAHEVHGLSGGGAVLECALHFGVVVDGAALDGFVDFHEVLIYDASGTDVEVTYFRVAHLSVRQTDVFAACLELGVRIGLEQIVVVGVRSAVYGVCVVVGTDAPTVENHE